MTRRQLVGKLVAGCWLLVAGLLRASNHQPTTNNEQPATKSIAYPGKVVPMGDIRTEAKWSG